MRTVNISKGGSIFAHHIHIESAAADIFTKLADERLLRGLGTAEFSDRAAYYLSELNALHPFRDGNGRAQREFMSHLAQIKWLLYRLGKHEQSGILDASIASFPGDTSKLATLIQDNLQPPDGIAP